MYVCIYGTQTVFLQIFQSKFEEPGARKVKTQISEFGKSLNGFIPPLLQKKKEKNLFALFYLTDSYSNARNRRDTGSVSLEDVRKEFKTQLRSVTASQLCSPPDKICLAGPPGAKGEPGEEGRKGKMGESSKTILSSLSSLLDTLQLF